MRIWFTVSYGMLLILTTGIVNLGGVIWERIEQLRKITLFEFNSNFEGEIDIQRDNCRKFCDLLSGNQVLFNEGVCAEEARQVILCVDYNYLDVTLVSER